MAGLSCVLPSEVWIRETLNARFSHGTQRHSDHFYPLRELQEPAVQIPQRRLRSVGEVRCRSHRRRPYPRRYALPKMRTGICAVQNVRRSSRAQDHPRKSVHKGNGMNESTEYQAPKQQWQSDKKRPGISKCQGVLVNTGPSNFRTSIQLDRDPLVLQIIANCYLPFLSSASFMRRSGGNFISLWVSGVATRTSGVFA